MTFSQQFEEYLASFRLRLKALLLARGAAVIAIAALALSLVAVTVAIRSGFPANLMVAARVIILAAVAGLGYFFFAVQRRRVDHDAAAIVQARVPAFDGRVAAYLDKQNTNSPLRELLAEDSLAIATDHAPDVQIASREFGLAWTAAAAAALTLLVIALAGPGNYSYGVRDLWVGWAFPGLLPPQSIEVSPGDDGIRLGGNIRVAAQMQGFDPAEAYVNARFGDGEWQQVPMSRRDDAFEFTFFSVRQPLEYFVSAANVRSPSFDIRVVDLPTIENLALTYHYPDWTGRDAELHDPGGDIRAIAGTRIELRIDADRAMTAGEVLLDNQAVTLDVDGQSASANFTIDEDGQYYVAARVGGERIRLSDDFFITVLDDEAPEISFARPGRDWSASRIEEVTTRISAEDDFRIDSLQLRYSVNGGDWQAIDLDAGTDAIDADHVFFLESLAQQDQAAPLTPGDLIAYYAIAEDRGNSARTDMFFIDVQPFDRRYSQSQQAGGAAGGQQGDQQNEISERQREIIISTWNLIREQSEQRRGDDAYVNDNAALLSRLQETLKGQVETLAQRTEARQLTSSDEEIAQFVEHLHKAAAAMTPAALRLGEIALEQALLPEQEALQHLLAAEAVFNDINISMQANNGGGGGGQAGRDLSEMFELEMDLEKNQYETGSQASPSAPQQQIEEAADELAELARRQEQLANNRNRSQTLTPEQRWQQEMLRRDVEELQQRLDAMNSGQQQSASQARSGEGQAGSGSAEQTPERDIDELQRRVSSALRAMDDADMNEAQRQLDGARQSATEAQQRAMQAAVNDLADRADELHATQVELEQRLQDAVRQTLENRDNDRFDSGLSYAEEEEIAAEKRALLAELQQLQRDAQGVASNLNDDEPDAADEIQEGVRKLQEFEIEARIAVAAAYIEQGEAIYVASSESAVTEALRDLREDLQRAEGMIGGSGTQQAGSRLQAALSNARALRRGLQDPIDDGTSFDRQVQQVSQEVNDLLRNLQTAGIDARNIDELRRLAAAIGESEFSGNPEILAQETRAALLLAEQLELALARAANPGSLGIRNDAPEDIPEKHRQTVADYYRKLGQTE